MRDVGEREASWELCVLAAFSSHPVTTDSEGALIRPEVRDSPMQRALRDLKDRHRVKLPPAVVAYEQALAVAEVFDAADVFAAWKANRGGGAGYWPTEEAQQRRQRVRAV